MSDMVNYDNLVIGKEYKCMHAHLPTHVLRITGILTIGDHKFICTNRSEYTYQVYPNQTVKFYEKTIYNNEYNCKIIQPYTKCPISWEDIEDGDEISIIDDRFIFSKEKLQECLAIKFVNPFTNLPITELQLKHYVAIIFP